MRPLVVKQVEDALRFPLTVRLSSFVFSFLTLASTSVALSFTNISLSRSFNVSLSVYKHECTFFRFPRTAQLLSHASVMCDDL